MPDDEVLRDSEGRVVDDAYMESAVDGIGKARKRGRPSLSKSGESPLLRVRRTLSRTLRYRMISCPV